MAGQELKFLESAIKIGLKHQIGHILNFKYVIGRFIIFSLKISLQIDQSHA